MLNCSVAVCVIWTCNIPLHITPCSCLAYMKCTYPTTLFLHSLPANQHAYWRLTEPLPHSTLTMLLQWMMMLQPRCFVMRYQHHDVDLKQCSQHLVMSVAAMSVLPCHCIVWRLELLWLPQSYLLSCLLVFITLRAMLSGAVYCYRSCLWPVLFVGGLVCCHDNSKLCASIFTKLGL